MRVPERTFNALLREAFERHKQGGSSEQQDKCKAAVEKCLNTSIWGDEDFPTDWEMEWEKDSQKTKPADVKLSRGRRADQLLALGDALAQLEEEAPQKAELVKLRYFAGLSHQDAASALGISRTTADRYWAYAKAFLYSEMGRGAG